MVGHNRSDGPDAQFGADLWATLVECVRDLNRSGRVDFREHHHGRAPLAHTWPLSQFLHAAVLREEHGLVAEVVAQLARSTHHGYGFGEALADHPGRSDVYVDDNAWVGLALAQASPAALDAAATARLVACASFCCATQHVDGAVPWRVDIDAGERSSNACSTAPTGVLALRAAARAVLHDHDHALDVARRAERFCTERLGRSDGLIADHVRADGSRDDTVWSYNQGSMVLLRTLLAAALDDERMLDAATQLADAALGELADDRLWLQPPAFNAVLFRGLLVLDAHRSHAGSRRALATYLDRVQDEAYDPSTALCLSGGIGAYEQATILDQAALVQLFTVAGWPPSRCAALC